VQPTHGDEEWGQVRPTKGPRGRRGEDAGGGSAETAKGGMDQSGVRTNMQHLVSVASKFAKTKNLHAKVGHEKKERRRKAKRGIDAVLGIG
jgi:hypothetical protein